MEPELQDLLVRIGLSRYAPVFEEEAITDLALLKSIGSSGFVDAMSELALDPYAAEALRDALFGPAATVASDEDELELETNEESDDEGELQLEVNEDGGDEDEDLLLEENAPNAPAPELASAVASTPLVSPGIPASIAVPGSVSVAAGASEQAARYKDEGNQAQQVGRFSEAAALYSKAIACDPREAVFFSNRAAAYVSLRRFGEALADARAAVELKPHWAKAHLRVGGALMGLGRPAEAKVAFEAACRLEPRNAQLRGLADEAGEAVEAEAAGGSEVGSNWVAVLNEEVRHSLFLDEAETATTAGDAGGAARAYGEYAEELNRAMDELREGETSVLSLRSGARGVLVDVDRMAGADGEALLLDGVVRRSGRRVRVRLWHLLTHYDWADAEGAPVEEDAKLAGEMESSAERDRARMERLGAGEGWPGLVKEMAHEVEAVVGVGEERKRYPAVFTQRVEGMPLPEVLDAESGCGGEGGPRSSLLSSICLPTLPLDA
jgi:tetratricopeptide (TPR) repeat protein